VRTLLFLILIASYPASSETMQVTTTITLENGAELSISEILVSSTDIELYRCTTEFDCYGVSEENVTDSTNTYVSEIVFRHYNMSYNLDLRHMYNAWSNSSEGESYFYGECLDQHTCLIRGLFSKGQTIYFAEWKICEGKQKRKNIINLASIQHLKKPIELYKTKFKRELIRDFEKLSKTVSTPLI